MDITEVKFGSLFTYAPRGTSKKAKLARTVMTYLKNDRMMKTGILSSENMARMIKKDIKKLPFADYFNSNTILVPTPKSSLLKPSTLWVPERLTTALVSNGLGKSSETCLERVNAVPKSSGQTDGSKRPKALQHYESMNVKKLLFEPEEIVLVDDVITRGSTAMGGVNRLAETFPNAKIRVFAMMRVISKAECFVDVEDPCIGTITMIGEDVRRDP